VGLSVRRSQAVHRIAQAVGLHARGPLALPVRRLVPAVTRIIRPGTFTVGFVGTLGTLNALETLIDAARLLEGEDIHVVLVGHGPLREPLTARAAGLSNVTLVVALPST
jgi:glycosyltransferase involved in cell wall biosynthesis